MAEEGPKVQTSSLRQIGSGDVMNSMLAIVNNTAVYI